MNNDFFHIWTLFLQIERIEGVILEHILGKMICIYGNKKDYIFIN